MLRESQVASSFFQLSRLTIINYSSIAKMTLAIYRHVWPSNQGHMLRRLDKIWMDGKYVDWDDAKIHVLTHALHYGFAVFEGIRCFSTSEGPAIFRLPDHMKRLANSAKIYRMQLDYTEKDLAEACAELVRQNKLDACYLRPIVFTSYGVMGLNPLKSKISVAIGMWEWGPYLGTESATKGVRCMISSWARVDSRSLPPQAKCAANYANSALAKMEAVAAGYDEAILLHTDGKVAEGTGENIFRVADHTISTPPASSGILRGLTRDTIIHLAQDEGLTFHRNDLTREELWTSEELFLTGTAVGVVPIREVSERKIGNGTYPITTRLQKLYDQVTHGQSSKYRHWLTYVNG
jgi:branched-chain amino acid aminotransferase